MRQQLIKTEYRVLHTDGTQSVGTVDWPEQPGYKLIEAVVTPLIGPKGTWIERVCVWHDGRYLDLFVDEDGHARGLPRNEQATRIYRANTIERLSPGVHPEALPWIVGAAVLFWRPVWF